MIVRWLQISFPPSHPNTFGCVLRWWFTRATVMHLGDEKDSCGRSAAFYCSRVPNSRRQPPQGKCCKKTQQSRFKHEKHGVLTSWVGLGDSRQIRVKSDMRIIGWPWIWLYKNRVLNNVLEDSYQNVFIVMTWPYFKCRERICPAWNTGCCCSSCCICLCCLKQWVPMCWSLTADLFLCETPKRFVRLFLFCFLFFSPLWAKFQFWMCSAFKVVSPIFKWILTATKA